LDDDIKLIVEGQYCAKSAKVEGPARTLLECAEAIRAQPKCKGGNSYFAHPGVGQEECHCCTAGDATTNLASKEEQPPWNLYSADPINICLEASEVEAELKDVDLESQLDH